jgi:hypothetical protein
MEIIKDTPVTCDDCLFKYNKGIKIDPTGAIIAGAPQTTSDSIDEANAAVVVTDDATGVSTVESSAPVKDHTTSPAEDTSSDTPADEPLKTI